MNPRSLLPLLFAALVFATGCYETVYGNGVAGITTQSAPHFDEVEIAGALAVTVVVTDSRVSGLQGWELSGDENLLPLVSSHVANGRLIIGSEERLESVTPLVLTLHSTRFERLVVTDYAEVDLLDVRRPTLRIDAYDLAEARVSGEADVMEIFADDCAEITLDVIASTGSVRVEEFGEVVLRGSTTDLYVDVHDSAEVYAGDLASSVVTVDARDNAEVDVCAWDVLDAAVLGTSTVRSLCAANVVRADVSSSATLVDVQ
jgi:hypothetical protein